MTRIVKSIVGALAASLGLAAAAGAAPQLVQYRTYTSPACPVRDPTCSPAFVGDSSVTLQATAAGNTLWVAATVSDYALTHFITVIDSQNNTYHRLNQKNDHGAGAQSVAQFYADNIAGGADTITVVWSSDNYKGVVAAEISGAAGASLVGSHANIQDGGLASGSDNVTSGVIAVGDTDPPALLVALSMDTDGGRSDLGGSGSCAPAGGTGFTAVTQLWNWNPRGKAPCYLATLETLAVGAAGNVAGTFTASSVTDPFVTVAAVFH